MDEQTEATAETYSRRVSTMTEQADPTRSVLERVDLSPLGAVATVAAVLIVTVIAPPLVFDAWTPRMAIIFFVGPLGLALIARLIAARDAAALALAAALAWMILSGALSDGPRAALFGTVGRDLSALTVVLAAGFWALGRSLDERNRRAIGAGLVGAATFAAIIAIVQVVFQVESGSFSLFGGRPTGTLTNPVYLGAIASAAAIEAMRLAEQSKWRNGLLAAAGLLGAAVSLSGSRVAAAATVLVVVGWVGFRRHREAVVAAVCVLAGLAAGVGLDRVFGERGNAADRLTGMGGSAGRSTAWRYGWEAWRERPLLGHGMGRYRAAVQGRFSPEFVREYAHSDLFQPWFDPHNLVVNLFVTVGAVGVLLFGLFTVLAARRIDVATAFLLIPLVLHWLLQPVSLFVLPIVLLFFGATTTSTRPAEPPADRVRMLLLVGALAAVMVVATDAMLSLAISNDDADRAASVAGWVQGDPVVSDVVAQLYATSGEADGVDRAVPWQQRATETEPDRPYWWTRLGGIRRLSGDAVGAENALGEAMQLQPYNVRAWELEAALARDAGDEERFLTAADVLCSLNVGDACEARFDG